MTETVRYIVVQFKSNFAQLPGDLETMLADECVLKFANPTLQDEWSFRDVLGNVLDQLLKLHGLGWLYSSGVGLGTIDIEFKLHDWSRRQEAAQTILDDLTEKELAGFAAIGLWEYPTMTVFYPQGATWDREAGRIITPSVSKEDER